MAAAPGSALLAALPTFGDALRYARRAARLTQSDLGIAVGYSREQINRLENGQRFPDAQIVGALFLSALGLDHDSALAQQLITLASSAHPGHHSVASNLADLESSAPLPHLSAPLTPFIGREDELRDGSEHLDQTRLLVIVGPGGMGKTRLAYEIAVRRAQQGDEQVLIAELAQLSDPARLADHVAAALAVVPMHGRTAEQALIAALRSHPTLLVLDNCEHLLMACAHLAETLLRACPQLHLLATSREVFGTLSAMTWRVPALSEVDAIRLFIDRARQSRLGSVRQPDFRFQLRKEPTS